MEFKNRSGLTQTMNLRSLTRTAASILAVTALALASSLGVAAENSASDPTGTWKIVRINPETKKKGPEQTLKLKLESEKLSGTITGRSSVEGKVKIYEWPLKDTKFKGVDISFTVTHAPVAGDGPDSTVVYEGKFKGDAMEGKLELEFSGRTFKHIWEAKRAKE
jgi:hypothetical protein